MAPSTNHPSQSPSFISAAFVSVLLLWNSTFVNAQTSSFALNPVKNFCSRWWAQSVIKNDVLYIDSGLQKWNGTDIDFGVPYTSTYYIGYGILGINNWLITIPMKSSWDWQTDIVINAEPKNETNPSTGALPPSRIRGHMFHGPTNSSDIFIYGGTTYMGNQTFPGFTRPDASTYALWSYNTNTSDYPWTQHDISEPWMANHGAAAEAIDQGLGFYLNGEVDWGTSVSTLNVLHSEDQYRALDGMLVINLYDQSSRNISTSGIRGNSPRVGGTMEYFAPVGGMGILVALGGQISQDQPWANLSQGDLIDFNAVDVFDIDSYLQDPSKNGTWYQQNTTGDIPPARVNFCTVAVSAPDNSSHHIYMYGGMKPAENVTFSEGFDDVYVLTLPSFTWTAIYTDGASPRYGHNCHRAGTRQMITVGGNVTNTLQCDWEDKGVAFLDMTTVTWGSVFLTNTSEYQVAQKLLPATGGKANGSATIKEPSKGWTDQGLKTVFDTPRKWGPSPTPTPSPAGKKKSHTGAIAGGVVGGVVGLALIAGILFFLMRRRKSGPQELPENEIERRELGEKDKKYELEAENEGNPAELPGPEAQELNAPREFVEADTETAPNAVELSGTNVVAGGRTGVPFVRTPGDDLPTPPLYSPGLSPPLSDINSPPPRIPKSTENPKKELEGSDSESDEEWENTRSIIEAQTSPKDTSASQQKQETERTEDISEASKQEQENPKQASEPSNKID